MGVLFRSPNRMLLKLVLCIGLALGQEVTDEVIDNINEATGIALKDSFRCGLFFPDPADKSPDKSALPYLNLYIFNATFDAKAECDSGTPNVERYNTFCAEVWDKGANGLEFGMYSNSCGNKLWDWAGRIHHEIVCCAKG